MKIIQKNNVEMVRKCKYNAGYDLLGAIDHHWHRSGYPCGIMNEFYELKPGESIQDVLEYNGESLLLLDNTNYRNLKCGDAITIEIYSSLFGKEGIKEGKVFWYFADEKNNILQRDESKVSNIGIGKLEKLINIEIHAPKLKMPTKAALYTHFSGAEYEISNHWDYWIFPDLELDDNVTLCAKNINHTKTTNNNDKSVLFISKLDKDSLDYLISGGNVILLGSNPFPAIPTTFQIYSCGRVQGNLATVIEDHPITNSFPHNGFCDWQFFSMLEGGKAVDFSNLNIPFNPIIEVVSSFKLIRKQSSLFELKVSKGKLLVCTLNISENDPAGNFMLI